MRKKISWWPTFSLKFGLVHLFIGKEKSDGRNIFVLLEEIEECEFQVKIHWLTNESPMFALALWPAFGAFLFWCPSHIPKEFK